MANSPPVLEFTRLDSVSEPSPLRPDFLGYSIESWQAEINRIGPVMQAEVNGLNQLILADHDTNLRAWKAPEDWLYGPPTSSGEFFNDQMGAVHITQQDGPAHRRSRKLLLPGFGIQALGKHIEPINDALVTGVAEHAGHPVNLHRVLSEVFVSALSKSQVHVDLQPEQRADLVRFEEAFISALSLSFDDQQRWHNRPEYLATKARAFALFEQIVSNREAGQTRSDTLQALMYPARKSDFEPLKHNELLNVVYLLLVAGVGNIAVLASCMMWSLQQQPEWQQRLRAELANFASSQVQGGLKRFPLLQAVIAETERCYLPAPVTPKVTSRAINIQGFDVAANTHVLQLHGMSHFDAARYPKPFTFNPERWLSPDTARANAYGGGTHLCLGMGVSRVLLPLTLAELVTNYQWHADDPPWFAPVEPSVDYSPPITEFVVTLQDANAGG